MKISNRNFPRSEQNSHKANIFVQVKGKWFSVNANKSYTSWHERSPGIVLLVIYLFIYLIPTGLIPHTVHDHLSEHDHFLESDPCHISIYHSGLKGGCDHKYHFTENKPPCPLCNLSLLTQIIVDPVLETSRTTPDFPFIIALTEEFVWHTTLLQEDRGPPHMCFS